MLNYTLSNIYKGTFIIMCLLIITLRYVTAYVRWKSSLGEVAHKYNPSYIHTP